MKIFKIVLLAYLIAIISYSVLPKMLIHNSLPNLLLIFTLILMFKDRINDGAIFGIVGALFLDLLGYNFASNILPTTAIILLVWFLIHRFFETSNIYIFLIFCFFSNLIYDLLFLMISHSLILNYHLLFNANYTALSGLLLYTLYNFFEEKYGWSQSEKQKISI